MQIQRFEEILRQNKNIQIILDHANAIGLQDWYLVAGCVAQTVWNIEHGFEPDRGIKDYDLVYFDEDTSKEKQDNFAENAQDIFKGVIGNVDVVNEARVHLWYEEEFGRPIKPYLSTKDAIDTFPTIATSVGVRMIDGIFDVYAPFGLDDVFNVVARANKAKITEDIYKAKVERWSAIWPRLTIIPWNE